MAALPTRNSVPGRRPTRAICGSAGELTPWVGIAEEAGDGAAEWARLRDKLVTAVQARAAMAGSILSSEAWDFVFYVFTEAHCAGHNCWHLHDPSHPRYMSQLAATVGADPVAAVYEELDRAIGNIIEQAGDDAICALLLSHGMGRVIPVTICSTRSWLALRAVQRGWHSGRIMGSGPQHCGASRGQRAKRHV